MAISRVVPIIRVTDLRLAMDFYSLKLGFVTDFQYSPGPDGPSYAGLSRDGSQIHLSTSAGDGALGTAVYCYVDDVDALFERFRKAGLKTPGKPDSPVEEGPVDQTWGMREVYVRDPDGNTLRFGSPSSRRTVTTG
jgi:catechol 2,3-dioxygenase-like lactoylglutathione lyase family enzyme